MTAPPRRVLPVLFLGVLLAALDIAILAPALPALGDHFGVDERALAWVFNLFVLFNLTGLPLLARLSDAYGRRPLFVLSVGLFAAGAAVVMSAPTYAVALVGRSLQGLGAGGLFPVASAVVGDVYPPERRGRALGVIGAVFGLAFLVGPILGGLLLPYGWRWLFVPSLPLALGVAWLGWRRLPGRPPKAAPLRLDLAGLATLAGALVLLTLSLGRVEAERLAASLSSPLVWGGLLGAAVLAVAFYRVELRAEAPLLRPALLRNPQILRAGLFSTGAGLAEAAFVFFPTLAVEAFGVAKRDASFMLMPLVVAVFFGAPLAGRLLDRLGSRWVILGGASLLVAGFSGLGLGVSRGGFYGASVAIGLGLAALLGAALSYVLLQEARPGERTVVQGVGTLFITVGQLTGSAFIGALAATAATPLEGFRLAFLGLAALMAAIGLTGLGLRRRAEERRRALLRAAEL